MNTAAIEAEIPSLRRYARALTGSAAAADDLVQDTLERALSRLGGWRSGGKPARPWLFAIMRNLWIDEMRRRAARPAVHPLDEAPEPAHPAPQDGRLEIRDLAAALAALADDQREVVLLVGLEGLSYAEVAAITGVPLGTVMSRLKRGRDRLARLLHGGEPVLRRVK